MQENFTDYMLEGMYQTDAYLKAYPNCKKRVTARINASQLLTKSNIKARLAYKRAELAKRVEIDEETQIRRFQSLSEGAEKEKQYSAAISAEDKIATICGLYAKDNAQQNNPTLVEIMAIASGRKSIESHQV